MDTNLKVGEKNIIVNRGGGWVQLLTMKHRNKGTAI